MGVNSPRLDEIGRLEALGDRGVDAPKVTERRAHGQAQLCSAFGGWTPRRTAILLVLEGALPRSGAVRPCTGLARRDDGTVERRWVKRSRRPAHISLEDPKPWLTHHTEKVEGFRILRTLGRHSRLFALRLGIRTGQRASRIRGEDRT